MMMVIIANVNSSSSPVGIRIMVTSVIAGSRVTAGTRAAGEKKYSDYHGYSEHECNNFVHDYFSCPEVFADQRWIIKRAPDGSANKAMLPPLAEIWGSTKTLPPISFA